MNQYRKANEQDGARVDGKDKTRENGDVIASDLTLTGLEENVEEGELAKSVKRLFLHS
jgi:hypothetical protein